MLEQGIVRPFNSPFASPIILVNKDDKTWRMYVDFIQLNAITVKNKFPFAIIEELLNELRGATVSKKLGLKSSYNQVKGCPYDSYKPAFHTHDGLFEFLIMPFGLANAPTSFQSLKK